MRFSVFTPTHRPDHLDAAFDSLVAQTCADWEWVVVLNGPHANVPGRISGDARVRVLDVPDEVAAGGVGALKRFACEHCNGDYFVELDHDDLLVPRALSRIAEAAKRTGAGFLYSDFANFRADGTCEVYDSVYGWESYPVARDNDNARGYTAMRAFDADASALHLIFFAPNHVRVWHRDTYAQAGGHDASLGVADDHDLICRTWLTGTPFHHIPECLYLYRLLADGANTHIQRNAEIQQRQQEISNRYIYALIAEWCRRCDLPMLDLGASGCPPGYRSAGVGDSGAISDLQSGLPYADSSAGCVRAYDFLEHVASCSGRHCDHGASGMRGKCVVGMMNEIHRVLAPGGWLVSRMPSTDGRGAFQDPTNVSFWNTNSFWSYTRRQHAQKIPGLTCRFQGTRVWQAFPSEWHKAHDIPYVHADLVALKGQRQPGLCEI
jgi:glycosyltransferase involved in cell wall biosynthesis